jgi:hypothetical protein
LYDLHLIDVTSSGSNSRKNCARPVAPAGVVGFLLTAAFALSLTVRAQEPAQPTSPPAESSSSKAGSGQQASKHRDDFLLRGTVFSQEGLALPGAELRIRRSSEKRPKWETITNARGNFAVRVKMGSDYEVVVRAKGFKDQSASVNAKSGERFKDLVFRMEHQEGKKS